MRVVGALLLALFAEYGYAQCNRQPAPAPPPPPPQPGQPGYKPPTWGAQPAQGTNAFPQPMPPTSNAAAPPNSSAPVNHPAPASGGFLGEVKLLIFSDVIATEDAFMANGLKIDFAKVEQSLKGVPGVRGLSFDKAERTIKVLTETSYDDLDKLRKAVESRGVASEIISPARVAFRPNPMPSSPKTLVDAFTSMPDVKFASQVGREIVVYMDLEAAKPSDLLKAALTSGQQGDITTHDEIVLKIKPTNEAAVSTFRDDMMKTQWVCRVDYDEASKSVTIVTVKGHVTVQVVKSVLSKHQIATAK